MTIKELETLTGMERANVRFYEREGLLTAKRMDNGYRDYSQEDVQILLRVKLLRSLSVPLEEIKALKAGSKALSDTLSAQSLRLEQEQRDAAYAQQVCHAMQADRVTFAELDARKYLDGILQVSRESDSGYFAVPGDQLPQVYHPWRRFLARSLDLFLYGILWSGILGLVFHVNLANRGGLGNLLDTFVAIVLMLLLEPLWLHFLRTTPGKTIFGLRIETPEGKPLAIGEGRARTWGVIGAGMGYNLPIYNLVRLWKSYQLCRESELQPWDEAIAYTLRDTKRWRGWAFAVAYACGFFVLFTMLAAQQLPPHRGDLTVSQFVENYTYYAHFYGIDLADDYLDETGQWKKKEFDGTAYLDTVYTQRADISFTQQNQRITGISFAVDIQNSKEWLGSYDTQMLLASLAFAGAQAGLFSDLPSQIATQIKDHTFQDYAYQASGISFACETAYSGYQQPQPSLSLLFPDENAAQRSFRLSFSARK